MPFPVYTTDGRVGIGKPNPTEILDVQGNVNVSGTITQSGTPIVSISVTDVGSTPSAAGASTVGNALTLQPADGTHPGVVTSGTQTIGGAKTFSSTIGATNLSGTNTGDVTLAAVGAAPSANGATLSSQVLTLQPVDATHPGVVTTGAQTIAGTKTFSSAVNALSYLNSAGTAGQGMTFASTNTVIGAAATVFIQDNVGTNRVRFNQTQTLFSNSILLNYSTKSGTSYVQTVPDCVIAFSNAAARTMTIFAGSSLGSGSILTVIDTSGSVNATHTITITPVSGTIDGAANSVITPGVNKTKSYITDGTNWFTTAAF